MSGFWRFRVNARIWWFQRVLYFIPVEYIVCPATHNKIKGVCELPVLIQSRNPSEIGRNSSLKDTVLSHFSNMLRLYLGAQTIFSSQGSDSRFPQAGRRFGKPLASPSTPSRIRRMNFEILDTQDHICSPQKDLFVPPLHYNVMLFCKIWSSKNSPRWHQ